MERVPRRAAIKSHARACLLAAGLALLAFAHANPFASPEPPPPPAPEIPLPPDLIDQLPPLPTPSLNAPELAPQPTPEEQLAKLLPQLQRPTLQVTPNAPEVALALAVPAYRPYVPAPTLLASLTDYQAATTTSESLVLQQGIEHANVQLLAVIHSGTPRAILNVGSTALVLAYGDTLPGGHVRISAILDDSIVLTYQGVSTELSLGEQP